MKAIRLLLVSAFAFASVAAYAGEGCAGCVGKKDTKKETKAEPAKE